MTNRLATSSRIFISIIYAADFIQFALLTAKCEATQAVLKVCKLFVVILVILVILQLMRTGDRSNILNIFANFAKVSFCTYFFKTLETVFMVMYKKAFSVLFILV